MGISAMAIPCRGLSRAKQGNKDDNLKILQQNMTKTYETRLA